MCRHLPYAVLALLMAAPLAVAGSKSATFPAGQYITHGGQGVLEISSPQGRRQGFEISTAGANGHVCDVEGEIRNGQSRVSFQDDGSEICQIRFRLESHGAITVDAEPNLACRSFCGSRAFFADTYYIPAEGCTIDQLTASNKRAEDALKEGHHAQARDIAKQTLAQCDATLRWEDSLHLRLLLTHASVELADAAQCRAAMGEEILTALANPKAIEAMELPPAEHYFFMGILEEIRPAAEQCGIITRKTKP